MTTELVERKRVAAYKALREKRVKDYEAAREIFNEKVNQSYKDFLEMVETK